MLDTKGICPKCCRFGRWNGTNCEGCWYDVDLAKTNPAILNQVFKLLKPNFYPLKHLYMQKELVPDRPGVYAWYFSHYFQKLFSDKLSVFSTLHKVEDSQIANKQWTLFYVGIAGKNQDRTLRDRIHNEHLKQNSEGSTLRQSLSAMLWEEIGLNPEKQLKTQEEKDILNQWMYDNARVTWIESDAPESIENILLEHYGQYLPMNIEKNNSSAIKPVIDELSSLRKIWRRF